MKKQNQTEGKTLTESVGVTETQRSKFDVIDVSLTHQANTTRSSFYPEDEMNDLMATIKEYIEDAIKYCGNGETTKQRQVVIQVTKFAEVGK